jgi:hypothetical protein
MKVGDLVQRHFPTQIGFIIGMTKPVPNEALVVWDDGATCWIAVWALELL